MKRPLISKLKHKLKSAYSTLTYRFDCSERLIGIMMIRNENDMLKETLNNLTHIYDRIFVLDGTEPDEEYHKCKAILTEFEEVKLILRDSDTPGPFPIRDGARQYLLDKVREKYGCNNWIGVLHGDELYSKDPRPILKKINPRKSPVVQIRLCHFFLHADDEKLWQHISLLPVEQRIKHYMWPGTPEDRIFFDNGTVHYDTSQHSLVVPYKHKHKRLLLDDIIIKQYNYRSPSQMDKRASQRIKSGWQSNHYEHIENEKLFFVSSLHVPGYEPCGYDNVRETDQSKWSKPRSIKDFPLHYLNSPIIPIFIGGVGRTGSTYVKQLLAMHSDFAALNWESKFISHDAGLMDLLYSFSEDKLQAFLGKMKNNIGCTYPEYKCKEINNWLFRALNGGTSEYENYDIELKYLANALSDQTLSFHLRQQIVEQFVHFLFDRIALRKNAVAWVEQTPKNIKWAFELLQCFQNSYFIYVFRDPRDVIASLIPLWWGPKSIEEGVEYYKERYKLWKTAKKRLTRHGASNRIFTLRFEELIVSVGESLNEIINGLGFPEKNFSVDKQNAHIGRWHDDFSTEDQNLICDLLSEELEEQNYL